MEGTIDLGTALKNVKEHVLSEPKAYNLVDFGTALKAMIDGKFVHRFGWFTSDVFIGIYHPEDVNLMSTPFIFMDTTHAEMETIEKNCQPWIPSHFDMLANDWIIMQ